MSKITTASHYIMCFAVLDIAKTFHLSASPRNKNKLFSRNS